MNKAYKVVWSKVKNCYVVASELAKNHTKAPKSGVLSRFLVAGVSACVLSCGWTSGVYAWWPDLEANVVNTAGGQVATGFGHIFTLPSNANGNYIVFGVRSNANSTSNGVVAYYLSPGQTTPDQGDSGCQTQWLGFSVDTLGGSGNAIESLSANGSKITFTRKDGTTGSITLQDNDTKYLAGNGVNLNGTTFSVKPGTNVTVDGNGVNVVGNGSVASGNTGLMSGGTAYNELRTSADGDYVHSSNTTGANLKALDSGLSDLKNSLSDGTQDFVAKTFRTTDDGTIGGDLKVDGKTDLSTVETTGDAKVGGTFNSVGDATFDSGVTVKGEASFEKGVTFEDDVAMNKDLMVDGNVSAKSDLSVDGKATFNGDTLVYGDQTVKGNINADSNVNVKKDLTVDGKSNLNGDTAVGGNLAVDGTSTLNGELYANENAYFKKDAEVDGKLTVKGDSDLQGNLDVAKDLNVVGNGSIGGNLDVTGDQHVFGNSVIDKDSTVKGNQSVEGNGDIAGTLHVGDNTTLDKDLMVGGNATVTGNTDLQGNASVGKDLDVAGKSHLAGDVTADSNMDIGKDLHVAGSSQLDGNTTVGTEDANADLFVHGNTTIDKDLSVGGDTNLTGNLTVGDADHASDFTVFGNSDVKGNSNVDGDQHIGGDLTVDGNSRFEGDTYTGGNQTVAGNADIGKNLSVGGTLDVGDNATFNKDVLVKGTLEVEKAVKLDDTLRVDKDASFGRDVDVERNLYVHGTADFDKDVTVGGFDGSQPVSGKEANVRVNGDVSAKSFTVLNEDGTTTTYIDKNGINAGGNRILHVADGTIAPGSTDAINGGQLWQTRKDLQKDIDTVGAQAAALANLHPLPADPDNKWSFAAAYGGYKGEKAGAFGMFYNPDENVQLNVSTTVGSSDNMYGAGLAWRFGSGNTKKKARASEVQSLKDAVRELQLQNLAFKKKLEMMSLDRKKLSRFPDVPKNHWAGNAVSTLKGNGYVQGYPDGEFKGDRQMTRYEYAEMLYNALTRGASVDKNHLREYSKELEQVKRDKAGTKSVVSKQIVPKRASMAPAVRKPVVSQKPAVVRQAPAVSSVPAVSASSDASVKADMDMQAFGQAYNASH